MSRMQGKMLSNSPTDMPLYVGIDVSKPHLDVHIHPIGISRRVSNDSRGINQITKMLSNSDIKTIVMEATGRYHRLAFHNLHDAGFAVSVVNPYRTRRFADTLGQLAKTDEIDAATLAKFASSIQPDSSVPRSEKLATLGDLLTARRQVCDEKVALGNQLTETNLAVVGKQIRARIKLCERHRDAIEKEIRTLISECPELKQRFTILTSIPGIALITAATLLAELSELGDLNASQVAALVGVAPMNCDSGSWRGTRRIKGGRRNVRKVIYMAAVTAIKANPDMAAFYERLKAKGKPFKVAISAVMRKIVILANTLVFEGRCWSKSHA